MSCILLYYAYLSTKNNNQRIRGNATNCTTVFMLSVPWLLGVPLVCVEANNYLSGNQNKSLFFPDLFSVASVCPLSLKSFSHLFQWRTICLHVGLNTFYSCFVPCMTFIYESRYMASMCNMLLSWKLTYAPAYRYTLFILYASIQHISMFEVFFEHRI